MNIWNAVFQYASRPEHKLKVPIMADTFLQAVYLAEQYRRERMPKMMFVEVVFMAGYE